jgi:NADH-quinone oxidoreductase subunit A
MKEYLPSDFIPIIIQMLAALGFIGITMIVTHRIGPNVRGKKKDDPFECGIESVGDARTPISVKYFLTAILFVLFDIEIIFMYPWAVNFKSMGMFGFVEMLVFLALLMAGFYYVIRKGVLDWNKD